MTVNTIEAVKAALGSLDAKIAGRTKPHPHQHPAHASRKHFADEIAAAEKKVLSGQFVDLNDLRNRIDAASADVYPEGQQPMVPNPPLPPEPGTRFSSGGQAPQPAGNARDATTFGSGDQMPQRSDVGGERAREQGIERDRIDAQAQAERDQRANAQPTTTPAPTTTHAPKRNA